MAALVVDGDVVRRMRWEFTPLVVGALLVAVSGALNGPASALFGVHGRYLGWVTGLVLVAAALVGAFVMGRDVRFFSATIAVSSVIQSGVVVFEVLGGREAAGLTGNSVLSGGWLAIAFGLLVSSALVWPAPRRAWFIAAAAVTGIGVIASGSRGAIVAAVVGAIVATVLTRPAQRRRAWAIGAAAGGAALVLALAAVAGSTGALSTGSTGARLEIWRATAAMIGQQPVVGVGPGRFLYEYPAYDTPLRARLEPGVRADQAHNELLQLAAEAGVPAALAIAAFFGIAWVQVVRAAMRHDASAVIVAGGLSAALGYSAFGITTVEIGVLVWMLAGMALARGALMRLPSESGSVVAKGAVVGALVASAGVAAVASGVYLSADRAYLQGLSSFEIADFAVADDRFARAVKTAPTVDVYRVALADGALYGDPAAVPAAIEVVDAGLRLEPDSYDLVMQRARLLSAAGAPAAEVARAYVAAVSLYPHGSEARASAAAMLRKAGDESAALRIERGGELPQ